MLFIGSDDLDDVPFCNLMDASTCPGLANFSTKQPRNFTGRTVLRQPLENKCFQDVFDTISNKPAFGPPLFGHEVASFQLCRKYLLGRATR